MVKPAYQQPIDATTYAAVLEIFEKMLALLHPYMPFITEELWQLIRERAQGESLMVSPMPKAQAFDAQLIERFELMKETIAGVRTIRQEKNIPQKDKLKLFVSSTESLGENVESIIVKLAGLELLQYTTDKVDGAASFMVRSTEFFVPLEGFIDVEEEIAKLKTELEYTKGFLNSVAKKLSNERFVSGAPANVVDMERKKQADAEAKIQVIEERLAALSK